MGAVLTHSPAFVFKLTFVERSLEGLGGNAGGPVLFRIEGRNMLADDLMRQLACETLCARVPATYISFRIKHVNRVITDAGDEQLEALFII